MAIKGKNEPFDLDQGWVTEAERRLRPDVIAALEDGQTYPEKIRVRISFTGQGKRAENSYGEAWPASLSDDNHVELLIPLNVDDPFKCLLYILHQMVHAVTGSKHDQAFQRLAMRVGFDDRKGVRTPIATEGLQRKLEALAGDLGPMPRKKLNYSAGAKPKEAVADKPKPQVGRMLKAHCAVEDADGPCGFTLRISASWVNASKYGVPDCTKHRLPLTVELPKGANDNEAEAPAGNAEPEAAE